MEQPKLLKHLDDLKALQPDDLLKYDGEKLVKAVDGIDYVTAQTGTTNGWKWTKYSDGRAECHIDTSVQCLVTTAWGVLYESEKQNFPAYPFEFIEKPTFVACPHTTFMFSFWPFEASNTTPGCFWVIRPQIVTSTESVWYYSISAWGRWK